LIAMIVKQIPVGPMQNFVYLLVEEGSREAMAIDSGWETAPIIKEVRQRALTVRFVVATHGHFDHVETIPELAQKLGAAVVAHRSSQLKCDRSVVDGDRLAIGGKEVRVLHTPGHTEDSICIYDGANLFTGDTLFIGNCGRTDLPGGSEEKLFHSLQQVIMKLPPETMIYPGHDYGEVPFRALGEEAKSNPALRARSTRDFGSIA
jgi:hydroxyacylglutathione hydrolase